MRRVGVIVPMLALWVLGFSQLGLASDDERAQPKIDTQEATRIVTTQFPNARIREMELDSEDGRLVYEVEFLTQEGQKKEVHVDAMTGTISKVEND